MSFLSILKAASSQHQFGLQQQKYGNKKRIACVHSQHVTNGNDIWMSYGLLTNYQSGKGLTCTLAEQ